MHVQYVIRLCPDYTVYSRTDGTLTRESQYSAVHTVITYRLAIVHRYPRLFVC